VRYPCTHCFESGFLKFTMILVFVILLLVTCPILTVCWQRVKSMQLYNKSRMPKFNSDDEEELKRITSGVVLSNSL
jgi:hypothetical protein